MFNRVNLSVLVRNCPCLYDRNDSEYGDKRKVNASWQAIASVLSISVSEVQKQWLKCCEIYYQYRNDENRNSADDETLRLITHMQFIEPHLINSSFPFAAGTSQPDRRKSEGSQSSTAEKKIASVRLIRLVQKHPVLYDRKDMYYRNKRKTEEAWNEIATALGENAHKCSTRWHYLRKSFRKYIKANTSISKKGKGQKSHPYAKELKFLIPVLAESVIYDTCKDQRRQIVNGRTVEVIEIGESDADDGDDEDDDELFDQDELLVDDTNNQVVDSTVNEECKAEKRANTDEQDSSNSKRVKAETGRRSNDQVANGEAANGEAENGEVENGEVENGEASTNEGVNHDGDNNNTMEEEETENAEDPKESDVKLPKVESSKKASYLDILDLENDPDMLFFRSLLPELHRMTSQQKNKFRMAVLMSIDDILSD